ncbi:MAG TPA: universal stress protein [Trichocoleus sp.]|jgi:nucleotide-binding universal stress UspA family protein
MKIKPMLMRLQNALGQENLGRQMLLYPGAAPTNKPSGATDLVIGYSGSPNSQTALDFAFWMAHQTKLATQNPVTVHVVYVLDSCNSLDLTCAAAPDLDSLRSHSLRTAQVECLSGARRAAFPETMSRTQRTATCQPQKLQNRSVTALATSLETADRILWQARCLADEWRGSLEAHLRFGAVTSELRQVVDSVNADVLLVGCSSIDHSLMQHLLNPDFPCAILGIPTELEKL